MASSGENEEARAALSTSTRIHISDLNSSTASGARHIEADVVLVYPYSSKTTELSLRLVERDVSLRKAKGQVTVTFHDAVAREVAESRPGIGDTVWLSLRDVELVEEQDVVATPGKKAGFTLHFHHAVRLQLSSDRGRTQLVDFVASTTPPVSPHQPGSPSRDGAVIAFETPTSNRIFNISKTRTISGSMSLLRSSQRISSNSFPGSMVDPFTEEDGYTEGRGRKRAKFARHSGAWKFTDTDDEETDTSHLPEDNGTAADNTPADHVREVERVVTSTNEALLVKDAVTGPISDGYVDVEDVEVLKHSGLEYEVASSFDDQLDTSHKDFEQLSSPESQISVRSDLSSSSTDQIRPVERMSLPPASSTRIAISTLEAVGSPGLAAVSPFVSRGQHFSPFPGHTPVYDANAHPVEPPNTFFQVPDLQVPNAIPVEESEAGRWPSDHEVSEVAQDSDILLAMSSGDFLAQDIDLDSLQQQIDLANGTDFPTEAGEEVIEDADMYGTLVSPRLGLGVRLEEQLTSLQRTDMPAANADYPIILDDDDDNEDVEELEDTFENDVDEMEEDGESYEDEKEEAEDEDDPRTGLGKDLQLNQINFSTEEVEEVAEESHNTEEERISVAESSSIYNSSPVSMRSDKSFATDDHDDNEPEPQQTSIELERLDAAEQSEYDFTTDNFEQTTSAKATVAPVQSLRSLDGISDEVLPAGGPLRLVDVVEVELPPVDAVRTSEPVNGTDARKGPAVNETLLGVGSSHTESERREILTNELPTPQATQSNQVSRGDQVKMQSGLSHEMPPTPVGGQEQPPEDEAPSVIPEGVSSALPQVDRTPARRTSQRLVDKPQMSNDVYSDYFTPRKSAARSKDTAPVENAKHSETQTTLGTFRPVSKVFGDVDNGLQNSPVEASARSRLSTAVNDVPWASSRGIATDLGYYVYLDYLGDYYDQLVDVLAVCTADAIAPERAKSGPKDFNTTIHLADSSASDGMSTTITVQIFRPHKHAIPIVRRGDVILLRNFKVQTQLHKPFLLSTDESAWVVFSSVGHDAIVTGPPVEFGDLEMVSVSWLSSWWMGEGKDKYSDRPTETQPDPANDRPLIKKPPTQPLDLSRSLKRTSPDSAAEDTGVHHNQEQSPSCNPQSPTFTFGIESSSMPPRSAWAVSPSSPTSVRMTRSTRSASVSVEAENVKQPTAVSRPPASSRSNTKINEDRCAQIHPKSVSHRAGVEHDQAHRKSIEDDGTGMSEGETSVSSKRRHRHERVSTSLIHELRDGTQYIDIDDFEIVSVSEEGTDDDQENAAQNAPMAGQSELFVEKVSPSSVMTVTPSKRGPGRPRKKPQPSQPHEQREEPQTDDTPSKLRPWRTQTTLSDKPSQSDAAAAQSEGRPQSSHSQGSGAMVGTERITRSKTAKEHNVHELRDGTVYED